MCIIIGEFAKLNKLNLKMVKKFGSTMEDSKATTLGIQHVIGIIRRK